MFKNNMVTFGFGGLVILQIADLITTNYVLQHGGRELNPIWNENIDLMPQMIVGKIVACILVAGLIWKSKKEHGPRTAYYLTLLVILLYLIIILNNIQVISSLTP